MLILDKHTLLHVCKIYGKQLFYEIFAGMQCAKNMCDLSIFWSMTVWSQITNYYPIDFRLSSPHARPHRHVRHHRIYTNNYSLKLHNFYFHKI